MKIRLTPASAVFPSLLSVALLAGCAAQEQLPSGPAPTVYIPVPGAFAEPEHRNLPELPLPHAGDDTQTEVTGPRPADINVEAVDIGPPPSNYQEMIRAFMAPRVENAAKVRYRFTKPPQKGTRTVGNNVKVSWFVVANINEPTAQGGYTGEDRFYFFFENGAIVDYRNFDSDMRHMSR